MDTNTEKPIPIATIYSGENKLMSRSAFYLYKDKGLIKVHYLGSKPYVYYSEINAAMNTESSESKPKESSKEYSAFLETIELFTKTCREFQRVLPDEYKKSIKHRELLAKRLLSK